MSSKELLQTQFDDAGFQLDEVLAGMSPEAFDFKLNPVLMSAREIVVHLSECYIAVHKTYTGEKHEWGTWLSSTETVEEALAERRALRVKAIEAYLASDAEDADSNATSFIVAHDYYHVGQLAALRLAGDPTWNAYSIYKH